MANFDANAKQDLLWHRQAERRPYMWWMDGTMVEEGAHQELLRRQLEVDPQ